ncbi:hypothetical protein VP01_3976g1 [Puccinia sorghi]|uniref:Uncharacterized protein n=1 Tax=Puccinia sorghi TaxID=27349 RepID=A0A0L6UU65_9BASI|nr:hypothetical protein VP01_3976g1 [Puccinia sorghi]
MYKVAEAEDNPPVGETPGKSQRGLQDHNARYQVRRYSLSAGYNIQQTHLCFISYQGRGTYFMIVILLFLADSSMHSEITSTPIPSNSNNPCRACQLSVNSRNEKTSASYVKNFLRFPGEVIAFSQLFRNLPREWNNTISNSYNLWDKGKEQPKIIYYNRAFMDVYNDQNHPERRIKIEALEEKNNKRLFNPFLGLTDDNFTILAFDGCKDTPDEKFYMYFFWDSKIPDFMKKITGSQIKDLKTYWTSINTNSLNMPNFHKVLQASPFVSFPFMNSIQSALWYSICVLGSHILQMRIEDLDNYIRDLQIGIDMFICCVIKISQSCINSFKLSHPGRDISNTFSNYQAMRLFLSGAYIWNKKVDQYINHLIKFNKFSKKIITQNLMGLNETCLHICPELRDENFLEDIQYVPEYLKTQCNPRKLRPVE